MVFNGGMNKLSKPIVVDTFEKFVVAVDHYMTTANSLEWRAGQYAFNLLWKVRPDITELLRGSDFDPFHKDANLPAFYSFVMRHWND